MRQPTRCAIGLLALVIALGAAGACDREQTHVTPLQFVAVDREYSCIGPQPINVVSLEIMRYEGEPEASGAIAAQCRRCGEGIRCPVIARQCLCVGERSTIDEIADGLAGLRLELPAAQKICVRVIGAHTGEARGPAQGPGSVCDDAICSGTFAAKSVRVCGLSDVGALSEAGSPLIIRDFACATVGALSSLDCDAIKRLCAVRPELEFCGVWCDKDQSSPIFDMTPEQCATLGR